MPRYHAYKILRELDNNNYTNVFASTLLDSTFKSKKLSQKNKALLSQIVYGVIRYKLRLYFSIDQIIKQQQILQNKAYAELAPSLKIGLLIGAYQLIFLDKIPDYAAVNETVKLFKKVKHRNLANKILRSVTINKNDLTFPKELPEFLATFYSYPLWLINRWLQQFGEKETIQICNAGNSIPPLTLRVNTLKTNLNELSQILNNESIEIKNTDTSLNAFTIAKTNQIDQLTSFKNGLFYVQDLTAMKVAPLLDPKPTESILDLCAAPGGKTTHLSQLMNNSGEIFALDVSESKINKIKENIIRLHIKNVTPKIYDGVELTPILNNKKFDKILIDAPCSNTGVLSRRIEARLNLTPDKFKQLRLIQLTLLNKAIPYLKEKGTIIYSTCSIDETENRYLINDFLTNHPEFSLAKEELTIPETEKYDGGYMAKLIKI